MASSWATTGPMTSLLASWLSWAVERFLYAEADLLARWQLHEWLGLSRGRLRAARCPCRLVSRMGMSAVSSM